MKKLIALLLVFTFCLSVFAACSGTNGTSPDTTADETTTGEEYASVTVRLAGLKGPTTMGMVKLLDDAEKGLTANTYDFTMAVTADEIAPRLIKGELDIAAVPANLAAVLYNNSQGRLRTVAVNTLGVLYIVEKGGQTVKSVADLKGQTIYATGKGTTPEYALNYLLEQAGLDPETDITVNWKSEPTEVVAQMATQQHAVAMLPQPFVTVAQTQLEGLNIAVDLSESWQVLDNGSSLVTSVLVVNADFADAKAQAVKKFLEEYAASATFVNAQPAESAKLIEKYDIVKAPVAEKAIPYCNLVCVTGQEMKQALSGYLNTLYEQNADSVGGQLPGDDFYAVFE